MRQAASEETVTRTREHIAEIVVADLRGWKGRSEKVGRHLDGAFKLRLLVVLSGGRETR